MTPQPFPRLAFLDGLDEALRREVIQQLRDVWTHASTAIEGNTLTLGETTFVLSEGLTVSGKSLKDHEEVVGHARAIELLYGLASEPLPITEEALFLLHKAVQTDVELDIDKPVGAWKSEPNWTRAVTPEDEPAIVRYAQPKQVPGLMKRWLEQLNRRCAEEHSLDPVRDYAELHAAFVRIHPFADGNGRMARLIANLPLLRAGHPPLIVSNERRM